MPNDTQLENDRKVGDRLFYLQTKPNKSIAEEKELKELHYKYYVENDDIRMYWKTY